MLLNIEVKLQKCELYTPICENQVSIDIADAQTFLQHAYFAMQHAAKRVFTCKNRCRYSRKRANICKRIQINVYLD